MNKNIHRWTLKVNNIKKKKKFDKKVKGGGKKKFSTRKGTIDFPALSYFILFIRKLRAFSNAIFYRSFPVHALGQMSFPTRDTVLKNTRFKGLQYGERGG